MPQCEITTHFDTENAINNMYLHSISRLKRIGPGENATVLFALTFKSFSRYTEDNLLHSPEIVYQWSFEFDFAMCHGMIHFFPYIQFFPLYDRTFRYETKSYTFLFTNNNSIFSSPFAFKRIIKNNSTLNSSKYGE